LLVNELLFFLGGEDHNISVAHLGTENVFNFYTLIDTKVQYTFERMPNGHFELVVRPFLNL